MALQETNVVVSTVPEFDVTKERPSKETTKKTVIRSESQTEYPVTSEVSCQNRHVQHRSAYSLFNAYIQIESNRTRKACKFNTVIVHLRLYTKQQTLSSMCTDVTDLFITRNWCFGKSTIMLMNFRTKFQS